MTADHGFAFTTQLSFQSRRVLARTITLRANIALHSIAVIGSIDDRWDSGDSGYDPSDPRFDRKDIAFRILSGQTAEQIKPDLTQWQALLKSATPPIGALEVTKFVSAYKVSEHEFPPVDCSIWVEPTHAERCSALFAESPANVRGTIELALRNEDLLEQSRKSAWKSRYLKDIDTEMARTFPVLSLQLQVQAVDGGA